jgi:hypothetical protein
VADKGVRSLFAAEADAELLTRAKELLLVLYIHIRMFLTGDGATIPFRVTPLDVVKTKLPVSIASAFIAPDVATEVITLLISVPPRVKARG